MQLSSWDRPVSATERSEVLPTTDPLNQSCCSASVSFYINRCSQRKPGLCRLDLGRSAWEEIRGEPLKPLKALWPVVQQVLVALILVSACLASYGSCFGRLGKLTSASALALSSKLKLSHSFLLFSPYVRRKGKLCPPPSGHLLCRHQDFHNVEKKAHFSGAGAARSVGRFTTTQTGLGKLDQSMFRALF